MALDDRHLLPPTTQLPSIPVLFDRIADANPNYPAVATLLHTESLQSTRLETTTFGELQAMSKRAAYFLTAPEHGICLKSGSTVALWVSNRCDAWMVSFLACTRIGALVLNLNPRFRETEMAHFLKTADPDLIILENGLLGVDYARMALEVAPNGGQKLAILNLGTAKGMPKPANYPRPIISLPPGFSFDAPDVLPELPEDCRGYADSPVVCFTTSGTTGPSKLAMHRQSAVVRMSVDLSWCWDMKPAKGTVMQGQLRYGKVLDWGGRREKMELDVGEPSFETRIRDILLLTVPYVGAFGFHIAMAMLLGAGGTLLMLDGYNPDVAAFYAHNYCPLPLSDPPGHLKGATHLCCPDAVHADLHNRAELYGRIPKTPGEVVPWDERPYRRVRWAHCSNFANIARPVIARAQELGPHYFKIQGYGMSESLACMAAWDRFRYMERTADGWRQVAVPDLDVVSRAGGRLNFPAEMDVKVVDPDTGKDQPCDRDHPGEIYFRGPQIQIGYLRNPEATNKSLVPAHPNDPDQRPWFKTGDFGYMVGPTKEDGFCFLNRLGDSLRLRGFLTNPGEIEDLIKTHPSVVEAQVVGCPPSTTIGGVVQESTTTGDVAVAFCIMREGGTKGELSLKKEIVDLCRRKLANYKVPAEVWFVTEYPVTVAANGTKVQRHRLREMARERGVTLERGRGVEGPKIGARL